MKKGRFFVAGFRKKNNVTILGRFGFRLINNKRGEKNEKRNKRIESLIINSIGSIPWVYCFIVNQPGARRVQ